MIPPGSIGSNNGHTTTSARGSSGVTIGDTCGPSLCYTCALTPTVVSGCPGSTNTGGGGANQPGMCTPRPGTGTTTLFTTHTITSCGMAGVCPADGYIIGGNATQSGATVVTTTDNKGHSVTYTQIPTGGGGGGGNGGPGSGGTGTGGTPTATTTNTAQPTCPYSNNVIFTSPMGMQYEIECNTVFTDETLDTQTQTSLGSCIAACDMYNVMSFMVASPCMGVSYYSMQEADNCMLKAGDTGIYQTGVHSGRLVSPYGGPSGGNGTGPGGSGGNGGGNGTGPGTGPGERQIVNMSALR